MPQENRKIVESQHVRVLVCKLAVKLLLHIDFKYISLSETKGRAKRCHLHLPRLRRKRHHLGNLHIITGSFTPRKYMQNGGLVRATFVWMCAYVRRYFLVLSATNILFLRTGIKSITFEAQVVIEYSHADIVINLYIYNIVLKNSKDPRGGIRAEFVESWKT